MKNISIVDQEMLVEDYSETDNNEIEVPQFDITSSPNDFNVNTIFDFIISGRINIPPFQRNYVWDIKRASKLIESLILGLPVPQIFLYEKGQNDYWIIDGHQRLMTIYYFIKGQFPRHEKRIELRKIFSKEHKISDHYLFNDEYFTKFNLSFPTSDKPNIFQGLNYSTLDNYKTNLEYRTIRTIIIKRNIREKEDYAIYEIFNRLNTGGVNLKPQEIRLSLHHSKFYELLFKLNLEPRWRAFLNSENPDLHMKDIEILLRGFAMLSDHDSYSPSMASFLFKYSKKSQFFSDDHIKYCDNLFMSFLTSCDYLSEEAFLHEEKKTFQIALYEAIFTSICKNAYNSKSLVSEFIEPDSVVNLMRDIEFGNAVIQGSAGKSKVEARLRRAKEILKLR